MVNETLLEPDVPVGHGHLSEEERNGPNPVRLLGCGLEIPMPKSDTIIPVFEEELEVSTRTVGTGRVRVETRTELIDEIVRADLESSQFDVSRVAVNRFVKKAPPVKTVGDVTIVPVLEEVLVVEKRLMLTEELHITRRVATEAVEIPVSVRKQRAVVTRIKDDPIADANEEQNNV